MSDAVSIMSNDFEWIVKPVFCLILQQDFQKAADAVKKLKSRPTDDELLQLYALFKQATEGDINTSELPFAKCIKCNW